MINVNCKDCQFSELRKGKTTCYLYSALIGQDFLVICPDHNIDCGDYQEYDGPKFRD